MTKQQLKQIYYTERELRMWECKLAELKQRSLVSSPLPRVGSGSGISDPTARKSDEIMRLEGKIEEFREKLRDERDEALQFILTIPNSITRMVVFYRCVGLMSWQRVAYEVGGGNTEDSVRMIYNRFVDTL